jgi:hypothetical protein
MYVLVLRNAQSVTWNLGLVRTHAPYFQNKTGNGHIARAMKANNEFPHPYPSFAYMVGPARGNKAPTNERRTVFAAKADAE